MKHANVSWITDTLATGGDLSFDPAVAELQAKEIVEAGIACVIDCRAEVGLGGLGGDNDESIWDEHGVIYHHVPTEDLAGHHIPAEVFDKAVIEARHHIDAGEGVLIHCHMGVNRGPSVAYAVLLDLDYDPVKAFDLIRAKRDKAAIYYAVDALEAELERRDFHHPVDVERLKAHIKKVMTPEERSRIQHIIRTNHQKDADEYSRISGQVYARALTHDHSEN